MFNRLFPFSFRIQTGCGKILWLVLGIVLAQMGGLAAVEPPLSLPEGNWQFVLQMTLNGARESAWVELRDKEDHRLYRLGMTSGQAQLQQWEAGSWRSLWKQEQSPTESRMGVGVFRYENYLFFEFGEPGDLRHIAEIASTSPPAAIDWTARVADAVKTDAIFSGVAFHEGRSAPEGEKSPEGQLRGEVIVCYVPWFPANFTALGYLRQYDFPVIPLDPGGGQEVLNDELQIMARHGITTVATDVLFFTPDRARAGVTVFKSFLDSVAHRGPERLKVVPFVELKDIPLAIATGLYLTDRLGMSPHWLKDQGRPVFLSYHNAAHFEMTGEKWKQLMEGVADAAWIYNFAGIRPALYGTEEPDYARKIVEASDGVFHFGASSLKESARFTEFIRKNFSKEFPDLIVGGSLHPGYYSARTYSRNFVSPRHTRELREMWEIMKEARPDFLHLTTWNDWNEATNFCPGFGDLGSRLEVVERIAHQFRGQPPPVGRKGEPEMLLSYRKAVYPGEPLVLELLPLPTQLGPKETRWRLEVTTVEGKKLLEVTSPAIPMDHMVPWTAELKLPAELAAPSILHISLSRIENEGSIPYLHLPEVMVMDPTDYGDQLYFNVPLHRLAGPDKFVRLSVNGSGKNRAQGSGLFSLTYETSDPGAWVSGMKRGHLTRFLAPLGASGAEVSELNQQVKLEAGPPAAKRTVAEWLPRWTRAERGPDYFAAVAKFPDGTWAYSPTVLTTSILPRDQILSQWVFCGPKPALMGNVAGLDKPQSIVEDRSIYRNDLPLPEKTESTFVDLPGNGRALQFDGRTLLRTELDTAGNGPMTVEALFRLNETGKLQILCMQRGAQANLIVEPDGHLVARRLPENRSHPNPFVTVRSRLALEQGRFYHAVATYDGSDLALYLDGELQEKAPCVGTRSTEGFVIGGTAGSPTVNREIDGLSSEGFFTGQFVKLTIFGGALPGESVRELNRQAALLPFWKIPSP
jgi:hypothetical protein